MAANSKFAMATHIMASVAAHEGERVNSSYLASSLNTNAVVVRRLLTELQKNGLLKNTLGRNGGAILARNPKSISLADIYKAVDNNELFAYNPNNPNQHCPMSCMMKSILTPIFSKAANALDEKLSKIKLSDVLKELGEVTKSTGATQIK
ncbi:MAG: Rrf2 family transcriptional regulator [Bdellovibrionota bacterium]